jgi:hypothetical protein
MAPWHWGDSEMIADLVKRFGLAVAALLFWLQPAAAQDNSGMSAQTFVIIIAALVLICAAFGAYLIYAGLRSRKLAKASETWPTASGTVVSSDVKSHTVRTKQARTTTYTPVVTYSYSVGEFAYQGSVIRFGDLSSGSPTVAQELAAKYPQGAAVSVRYDPAEPGRATLETVMPGRGQVIAGISFIVVPLLIAGIGALIFGPRLSAQPPAPQEQTAPAN